MVDTIPSRASSDVCDAKLECGGTGELASPASAAGSKHKRHEAAILKIAEVLTQQVVGGVHMALEEHLSRQELLIERCFREGAASLSDQAPDAAVLPAPSPALALAHPPCPKPGELPQPLFCAVDRAELRICTSSVNEDAAAVSLEQPPHRAGAACSVETAEKHSVGAGGRELMASSSRDHLEIARVSESRATADSEKQQRQISPQSRATADSASSSAATAQMWSSGAWAEALPSSVKNALDAGQRRFDKITEHEERSGFLWDVVTSSSFDAIVCTAILLNAILATMKANFDVQHPLDEDFTFSVCELVFQVFFTIELVIKILVYRIQFCVSEDWAWNAFDSILVFTSFTDQAMKILASSGGGSGDSGASFSFMRAFRLLRVVKVFRLFRVVRFFKELYLMMASLVGAMRSLFWSIVVIAFSLYIFALLFMQGVTSFLRDNLLAGVVAEEEDALLGNFGSMTLTIVTLFKAGTGGADWGEFYDLVSLSSPIYGAVFLLYVAFFGFAVVNVLTGMIVENVGENCRKTMEKDAEIARKKKELADMKKRIQEETGAGGSFSLRRLPTSRWPLVSKSLVSRQVGRRAAVVTSKAPNAVVPVDSTCCP